MIYSNKTELIYVDIYPKDRLLGFFFGKGIYELDSKLLIKAHPEFAPLKDPNILRSAKIVESKNKIVFSNSIELTGATFLEYSKQFDVLKENKEVEKVLFNYLKAIRKKENITQKELAVKSGLKQSAIARLEKGTNDIQLSTLMSYLKPLGYKIQIIKE